MNTEITARRLLLIIFIFMVVSQILYTYQNINMFRYRYSELTEEQLKGLGEVIRNEISNALKYNIPLESLGQVNPFLQDIVDSTPNISHIEIVKQGKTLYGASKPGESLNVIKVPIFGKDRKTVATILLGSNKVIEEHTRRIFFDLCTIVAAALIITYELLLFFTSLLVNVPGKEATLVANCQLSNLKPLEYATSSYEFGFFLSETRLAVEKVRQKLLALKSETRQLAQTISEGANKRKQKLLDVVNNQEEMISGLLRGKADFRPVVNPAHVRPMVFTFVLSANLHSCFLPHFAKDLLGKHTFLSDYFSVDVLMGLPITAYMATVMMAMTLMGTGPFQKIRPFPSIAISLLSTAAGLVLCGLSQNIVHLIAGRIFCGFGLAMIVIQCRQHIVDHSTSENRAYNLAGYTTAFSGGMFCSIVLGGILVDYFSYRIVYFIAAGLMVFVFLFTYAVFAGKEASAKESDKPEGNLSDFFKYCIRDKSLMVVAIHGIVTRIMFVGFLYYSLPVLLKIEFSYSDIGRIMMTYGLTCILLASWLNRYIKRVEQSRGLVFICNMVLGAALSAFYFLDLSGPLHFAIAGVGALIVMGISNSITFPSQINLLLMTDTAKKIGNRTPMALYQSFERIGSALGPIAFGFLASAMDIQRAIGIGGLIGIGGNLLFICVYRTGKSEKK